ncbi:hypothetical protein A9Q83_13440 [Alphaproteobacteria bacterium 46_93_T64]|nr:hypothetical protein A9Q83_13440 [Alphaproteobacteria bacterium 46_93_T64]
MDHLIGYTLYPDGQDEHRSHADGIDVMDPIIGRLKQLSCPKIRISCRTAEWHGGKDLSALSVVSINTPVVLLDLQPFTQVETLRVLEDWEDFVEEAREHGLDEFLLNPQDFQLLHEFYKEKNSWPKNRSELMDGSCKALLIELNEAHSTAIDDWITDRALERASNYLFAVLLLSNVSGISTKHTFSNKAFPSIQSLDGDLYAMTGATRRRVLKSAGENR